MRAAQSVRKRLPLVRAGVPKSILGGLNVKIYTRTGDGGLTSLYRGGRVPKCSHRLEAYGTLDELNSVLGQAIAHLSGDADWLKAVVIELRRIQKELFNLGAQLATLGEEKPAWHVVAEDITKLEESIDAMDQFLPPMMVFILPGGHLAGATLHVARTVARRAERAMVAVNREGAIDPLLLTYINRLSDYLFVVARYVNHQYGTPEPPLNQA